MSSVGINIGDTFFNCLTVSESIRHGLGYSAGETVIWISSVLLW